MYLGAFVAVVFVCVGLPIYLLFRWLRIATLFTAIGSGFAVIILPGALFLFFISGFSREDLGFFVLFFGGGGAVSAAVFWFFVRDGPPTPDAVRVTEADPSG
ncbi:MAG: hypothetical protein OEW11_11570 [Nitrospirota bacterium]|nr:hypothetical protein [Nitrospirota bacterium]